MQQQKEAPSSYNPCGRGAAKAKEAARQELNQRVTVDEEVEAIRNLLIDWLEADDERPPFLSHRASETSLQSIPEVIEWQASIEAGKAAAIAAASTTTSEKGSSRDNSPVDFISIRSSSSIRLPSLPANSDSDSASIEIVQTTRIEASSRSLFDFQNISMNEDIDDQDRSQMTDANYGGFVHNRAANRYSDDEAGGASIHIGGIRVTIPKSRQRR